MSDDFANINIDDKYCCDKDGSVDARSNDNPFQNQIARRDIIQMNNKTILKGLVTLENIFDKNDVAKNPKITANEDEIKDCNIGTKENPKMIKLLKTLGPKVNGTMSSS
jgi:hypothetical protein